MRNKVHKPLLGIQSVLFDLKRSSIEEIWSSPRLARFRELHLRGTYAEMPLCGKCWGHSPRILAD